MSHIPERNSTEQWPGSPLTEGVTWISGGVTMGVTSGRDQDVTCGTDR